MRYKTRTLWIFVALIVLIALMIFFPNSVIIWLGIIATPILVGYQAYIILKADDESPNQFSDDKWYDN
jgi:4-hydroxybenzoate polyprenyltransferase